MSLGITAAHQHMAHPACDFAKHVMQVSLAGTGVWISDGSTNVLPVPLYEVPASDFQRRENQAAVLAAWQRHAADVKRLLAGGFYQGWDLHLAQLPTRFGALFAFFQGALPRAAERMRGFLARATHASDAAGIADDLATGQALLNFLVRGTSSGAITDDEATSSGLTVEEIRGRSFPNVLLARRRQR